MMKPKKLRQTEGFRRNEMKGKNKTNQQILNFLNWKEN